MIQLSRIRQGLFAFFALIVFAASSLAQPPESNDDVLPNIVLILSDDQAWNDYGFMGHEVIETPCLDRLAAESLTFMRGYVPTSLCRPSLASIITGLYPSQHQITGNDPGFEAGRRGSDEYRKLAADLSAKIKSLDTLPRMLADQGYVSLQTGKWWEGSWADGGFTAGMTHGDVSRGGRHGDRGLKIGREGLQEIFDFIGDTDGKPFFVWYAPFLPHTPHNPPGRLLEKYQTESRPESLAKYYAMCEWLDETCGQLVGHIDDQGLGENTIVIYVTDNGWIQRTPRMEVPENWTRQFAPGSKQSPFEGGIRTPVMIRWPGTVEPRIDNEIPVSSIDLAPTILAAAGIEKSQAMTGCDLMTIARGEPLDRDTVFGEIYAHDIADIDDPARSLLYRWCISGNEKLVQHFDGQTGRNGNLHRHMQGDRSPLLFDLSNDPHETENIYGDRGERAAQIESMLEDFFSRLPDPRQEGDERVPEPSGQNRPRPDEPDGEPGK